MCRMTNSAPTVTELTTAHLSRPSIALADWQVPVESTGRSLFSREMSHRSVRNCRKRKPAMLTLCGVYNISQQRTSYCEEEVHEKLILIYVFLILH